VSSYEPYHKTTIDCAKIRPHTKELVDRCGDAKAAGQYALVAGSTIRRILHGTHCTVQKETARRILVALEHRRIEDRKAKRVHENLLRARQEQARIERSQEALVGY